MVISMLRHVDSKCDVVVFLLCKQGFMTGRGID